jgi:flavoprotein
MPSRTPATCRRMEQDSDVRCPCGRLIACLEPRGLVLKCPRCKTEAVVPMDRLQGGQHLEIQFRG